VPKVPASRSLTSVQALVAVILHNGSLKGIPVIATFFGSIVVQIFPEILVLLDLLDASMFSN
jgi:hypothetical protein